jgi:hypothetical protein
MPSRKSWGGLSLASVAWTFAVAGTATPVEAQESTVDRARLEAVLVELERGDVPVEELTSIAVAAQSVELRQIMDELTRSREEVRALRERYVDDYPPIRDRLETIAQIEGVAIPRVVRGILGSLPGLDEV